MCKDGNGSGGDNTEGKCDEGSSKAGLKSALGTRGAEKWPKISKGGRAYDADSTEKISGEMAGFNTEEKGITAGLFARTVE